MSVDSTSKVARTRTSPKPPKIRIPLNQLGQTFGLSLGGWHSYITGVKLEPLEALGININSPEGAQTNIHGILINLPIGVT